MANARASIAAAGAEIRKAQSEIERLADEVVRLAAESARLQREREQLIDERCELKTALDHWITEHAAEKEHRQAAERERDEAERTIGALKHRIGEQTDEIARLTRERDEAVRVAVWAAKHESEVLPAKMGLPSMLSWNGRVGVKFPIEYRQLPLTDTTDSDIYRALREAMGASDGGIES